MWRHAGGRPGASTLAVRQTLPGVWQEGGSNDVMARRQAVLAKVIRDATKTRWRHDADPLAGAPEEQTCMQQPPLRGVPTLTAPTFYLTGRQTLGPGAIVLATVLAAGALFAVLWALKHNAPATMAADGSGPARSAATPGAPAPDKTDDKDDDPNQVDTIVLGDAGDAPVPARKGEHVSAVHATIIVHLPRFGDEVGLIPDSAAGRLLYGWLAAFNQGSYSALANALPSRETAAVAAEEMELRRETGGFALLSAKEVQPGLLVFRLRDQTPAAGETLGSLQVLAGSSPAVVASFSLRTVSSAGSSARDSGQEATPASSSPSHSGLRAVPSK